VALFITLFHLLTCAIKKLHNARRLRPTSWQMKNYYSEWYSNLYVCMWWMWEVGQLLHEKGGGAFYVKYQLRMFLRTRIFTGCEAFRSFATRVSQLKIGHFWFIGIERKVCRCTFSRYSVITQFEKLAAGEQLCGRCTHRKLQHFKTLKSFSWKITYFELWHCCRKWAISLNKKLH